MNQPSPSYVWQCAHRHDKEQQCPNSPTVKEELLKSAFMQAIPVLYSELRMNDNIFTDELTRELTTENDKKKLTRVDKRLENLQEQVQKLVDKNRTELQNQETFMQEYESLLKQYKQAKEKQKTLTELIQCKQQQIAAVTGIYERFRSSELPHEFSVALWSALIDHVDVESNQLTFCFKNGSAIPIKIDL